MNYIAKNIPKSKTSTGTRTNMSSFIAFVPISAIKSFPLRDSNGVKMVGNLILNEGAYVEKIYATPTSIKITKNADGEEDAVGWLNGSEFSHPGDELEISEFTRNRLNVPGVIVIGIDEHGIAPFAKIVGSPSSPLTLKVEGQHDNDATKSMLKFEGLVKTKDVPYFYYGTLTEQTPVAVIAADATTVDVTEGSGEYQTTTGTTEAATIAVFNNVSEGDVITLKGSGGTYPTMVAASANILLYNGASYTANANTSLTLTAFKNGDNSFAMIELSRS